MAQASCILLQLHLFASCTDSFTELSATYVIRISYRFGFT